MKRINRIFVTGGLVVILLIIEIIIIRSASDYKSEVGIVFAKTHIPEGTVVREDMLDIRKVDANIAHKNAAKDINEVIGKEARMNVEEGEMVLTGKLRAAGETGKIEVINKENRLFSVEFKSDQANGWQLSAGQYVDIIFVPDDREGIQSDKTEVDTGIQIKGVENFEYSRSCPGVQLLKNIRVAALIDEKGEMLEEGGVSMTPKFISFEVSQSQGEFLAWAKSHGRLEILLIQKNNI